jgi:hypothetical protein
MCLIRDAVEFERYLNLVISEKVEGLKISK